MNPIELLERELDALRRSRDQSSIQIVTAKNALDAGLLTLSDISSRISRIEACLDQVKTTVAERQEP